MKTRASGIKGTAEVLNRRIDVVKERIKFLQNESLEITQKTAMKMIKYERAVKRHGDLAEKNQYILTYSLRIE